MKFLYFYIGFRKTNGFSIYIYNNMAFYTFAQHIDVEYLFVKASKNKTPFFFLQIAQTKSMIVFGKQVKNISY